MKVIVAGAGTGGLVAAERLGKLGFEVTVYEKAASLDEMRYDWHDDVNPAVFKRLGMEVPAGSFPKKNWTFVSPHDAVIRGMTEDESAADVSVDRRTLNKTLVERAAATADVVFGAEVQAPLVDDGKVVGVVVNGEEKRADLVVDSLGVDSILRKNLPAEFGVSQNNDDEVFVVWRAFMEKDKTAPEPKYTNKAYLKHMGEAGISWVIQDHDPDLVDVLVGRVGALSEGTLAAALADLKKSNPTIGDKVVKGGIVCRIPVRFPATRMIAPGYAAVGDSAFMTIPMLGSGIASSMTAGMLLAETVGDSISRGRKASEEMFGAAALWRYQLKVYREFGAEHCGVDAMKRGVLVMENEDLDWMLGSDLLTNDEMCRLAKGKLLRVGVGEALRKLRVAGFRKLGKLLSVNNLLQRSLLAWRRGKNIPRVYHDATIRGWERRLSRVCRK